MRQTAPPRSNKEIPPRRAGAIIDTKYLVEVMSLTSVALFTIHRRRYCPSFTSSACLSRLVLVS